MPQLPTGTLTFLFTDIEGSTKLWERCPEAMRLALARHDQLLRQAIEANNGFVFKTVGDAFCAAFAIAPDALNAAVQSHLLLQNEEWEETGSLRVRMGLHTGQAEERDGDYFGPTLNRVARLQAVGHGQQTLLSQTTYTLVHDSLPPDVALREMGLHRLKDLLAPEQVWQLLHPALPSEFPPLKSLDYLPTNLSRQMTSFIGREREMAEVKQFLSSTPLLTLLGSGGAGKTRLALQVGADVLDDYKDGVWLVELASLSDPELVPQTVASALGAREETGRSVLQSMEAYLQDRQVLLVLDNCEHLLFACANLVDTLLKTCSHLTILATSREPLGIAGERLWRVPSLLSPSPADLSTEEKDTAAMLMEYDACRLFVERALVQRQDFVLTRHNGPAVAHLCQQLDGIPLAIELAAARVRSLSVEEINSKLDNRFRLLTGGSRTALPRQQTLRALIDWSYDLLNAQEKTLLCRLSVFAGGWTLAAAEAVGAGEEIEDWEMLDLLTSLGDKSLVVYTEIEGAGRYRLLETIRLYAAERLMQLGGQAEATRARHRDWFFALAREAEAHLEGPDLGMWLTRLSADLDNLRAALDFGLERAAQDLALAIRVTQAVAALRVFWRARAMPREGHAYAAAVLAVNTEARGSEEMKEQMSVLALMHSYDSDYATAARLMEERLAWCRARGHLVCTIHTLFNYATILDRMGDAVGSQRVCEECLEEIARASASGAVDAETLRSYRLGTEGNLAVLFWDAGNYGRAFEMLSKNLPDFRALRNADWLIQCLLDVGMLLLKPWEGRDLEQAEQHLREGLSLGMLHGHYAQMLDGLCYFAALRAEQVRWSQATRLYGAAEGKRQDLGVPLSKALEEEFAALVSHARAFLGPEEFAAAWDVGQAMTLEQAVAYALGEARSTTAS